VWVSAVRLKNAAQSYSLWPTQLNKEQKLCLKLATHLRARRVELSPANAVVQRKIQTPAALVPVRVQTSNLAKMVAAVVHRTAQTTHLAQTARLVR
jgi:hypothetical protein